MDELVKYMRALVYLQLEAMTGAQSFRKPELLLSEAGFTHAEIAKILNKTPNAVKLSVHRARKAQGAKEEANDGQ